MKNWYCSCVHTDPTELSATQNHAFLDLLILAMHADGHLSSPEDKQLQKLLVAMGFTDAPAHAGCEFDQAVARISPSIQSIPKAKELGFGVGR